MKSIKYDLPFLALRDVVVFPGNVTTLFVGREKSINALNHAMSGNKKILLGAQRDGTLDDPDYEDIFDVITTATPPAFAMISGMMIIPFLFSILSASYVTGPLAASTIRFDFISEAFSILITFSLAAGIKISNFSFRRELPSLINSPPLKP